MDRLESKMASLSLEEGESREILNWFINKEGKLFGDIKYENRYIYDSHYIKSVRKDKNCFIVNGNIKVQSKNLDSYFMNQLNSFTNILISYIKKE